MQQVRTDITTDMADQTTVSSTNVSMATPLAPKNNQKIVLVVQIIILPVIVLGNSLILWAIKKSPSLRKVTYYLLGNLAVADLLFGIMLAIRVMVTFADMFSIQMCLVLNELGLVPVGSSISGVLLICVHNFNSVKSLRHLVKPGFNFKATWIMMAVSWFGWCILSISGYLTADTTAEINNRCFIGNGAYHRGFLATLSVVSIVHFVLIITFQACTIITIQQQRALPASPTPCSDPTSYECCQTQDSPSCSTTLKDYNRCPYCYNYILGALYCCTCSIRDLSQGVWFNGRNPDVNDDVHLHKQHGQRICVQAEEQGVSTRL